MKFSIRILLVILALFAVSCVEIDNPGTGSNTGSVENPGNGNNISGNSGTNNNTGGGNSGNTGNNGGGNNGGGNSIPANLSSILCFTAAEANSDVSFFCMKLSPVPNFVQSPYSKLEYSTNGTDWIDYSWNKTIYLKNVGDKVYFRGDNDVFYTDDYPIMASISGQVKASGSIMSMLDKNTKKDRVPNGAFRKLFYGAKGLISAPELPATILGDYCYAEMFRGTGLVTAPDLPATSLSKGCYHSMFELCRDLVNAPKLPATMLDDWCYSYMFCDCYSLKIAPELPAKELKDHCYCMMFYGCSNLIQAPKLAATSLGRECYCHMFADCTSLEEAPDLPATTLPDSCYEGMFEGCSALKRAPVLPAITLSDSCYEDMFKSCYRLSYIKMMAVDISAKDCLKEWVNWVSTSGTFVKNQAAKWNVTGHSGVPEKWTVQFESN